MLLKVFADVLLPIVLVAGLAFILGRRAHVDPRPLARTTFYLFNPCLAFTAIVNSTVAPELVGRLVLAKVGTYLLMIPLVILVARMLKLSMTTTSAFLLATLFANSGNMGLSVNEYAFGQAGLTLAVACYLTDNLAMNSLAVFLAARGKTTAGQALRQVFLNPAVYAFVLAILLRETGRVVPLPLTRTVELLGRAAIPTMLAVLGLQLASLRLDLSQLRLIGVAAVLRLLAAPAIAFGLSFPLGLGGLARNVAVLQCAMPSAVTASIVAGQYDTEPGTVSGAVMTSSLASLLSLAVLLTWMTLK